jgi:hypothetical protein
MILRSTQSLTEMSTEIIPGSIGRQTRKADNLAATFEPIIYKMWDPRRLTSVLASTSC